jgi:signal transduction histidine kinase
MAGALMTLRHTDALPMDVEDAVNIERIITMSRHQPVAAAANLVSPALLSILVWPTADKSTLIGFLCVFLLITILQFRAWWTHRGRPAPRKVSTRTLNRMVMWAGLWGLCWGLFTAWLIALNPPPTTFAIVCGVVMGLAAGGMTMLYPTPRAVTAFFIGIGAPSVVVLLAAQDMDCLVLAIFEIFYFSFLFASASQAHKTFITDVTLKLQNAELAYKAEAANRSKSRFLANMSHELRTPLNAINGFAEFIQHQFKGPVGNPQYLEFAKAIHDSGQHLMALIDDILDISKIESGQGTLDEKQVSVSTIISQVVVMTESATKKANLSFEAAAAPLLPEVIVDERKICQVLMNLVSNAVKFTPEGGRISVQALSGQDGNVLITVSDTGAGIAADEIQDVLKPFMRSRDAERRQVPGTGLGLHLAQELMKLHGGGLSLSSIVGKGTVVTVNIPAERVIASEAQRVAS